MKNEKATMLLIAIVVVILFVGGTCTLYALSDGTFDMSKVASAFKSTEVATEPPTSAPTEPPTTPNPELEATISSQQLEVTANQTAQLTAVLKNVNPDDFNIRYITSDENIASINAKGFVTPMSQGECQVGVYVEGYDSTIKNFTLKVTDSKIEDIQVLNKYLFSLNTTEEYTYAGSKKGKAKLTGCKIDDFDKNGTYELFLVYKLAGNFQKVQVVTVSSGNAVVRKTPNSYSKIVGSGYSSYIEKIYTDGNGDINIIAEYTKDSTEYKETNTAIYSTVNGMVKIAEYYSKEPLNINLLVSKSEYKIEGKKTTRDKFTEQYTELITGRTHHDDFVSISTSFSEGNYIKSEMPANVSNAYYNRLKWTSSDTEIAKVSETGVITGGSKAGTCTVQGILPDSNAVMSKMTITINDVTDVFTGYIESIKHENILGRAGNKMKLYGYYIMDLNGDTTTDLLLYYTGGNGCQLNLVNFVGGQPTTRVVKSITTENGVGCMLNLYNDSMNNSIVLGVQKFTTVAKGSENTFHYESYSGGEFTPSTSKYTYKKSTSSKEKDKYLVGGEEVTKENFNAMLVRYKKLGDWTKVKID
ncbi:MAG: hypothetical protein UH241_09425 [Acutalibacteraceae bacterium]|nr:hypothetical protein [Acutalibacteraceae bacterium]